MGLEQTWLKFTCKADLQILQTNLWRESIAKFFNKN